MLIIIKLGKMEQSQEVHVEVQDLECPVIEFVQIVRSHLPLHLEKLLNISEASGATVFLSQQPNALPLSNSKRLSDYSLKHGSKLWLMCAHST
jgi:hypothetical protein